jgi:hypothetical protein
MVNLSKIKTLLALVVLQSPHFLEPAVAHDRGVWGGWGTAAQPQPPWNSLWSNLIWDNELDGRMGQALVGCLGFAMAFH